MITVISYVDPDYTDDKDLYPITMSCNETGGEFTFSGCYLKNQGEGDNPSIDDPTVEQKAKRIININAIYWFDPDATDAITPHADGNVESITSVQLPGGLPTYTATRTSTSAPSIVDVGGVKYASIH